MEKEKIIEYVKKRKTITVPSLQKKFALSYNQAKTIVDELVADDRLVLGSGITYKVCAEPPKSVRRHTEFRSLSDYFAMRRSMEEDEDDVEEDDGEDDDFGCGTDGEDEFDKRLRELGLQLDEAVEEEDDDIKENEEEDELSPETVRERLGKISERLKIKKIFNDCIGSCVRDDDEINERSNVIKFGENKNDYFVVRLIGDVLQISDDGLTIASDCTGSLRAMEILDEYKNVSYESGEIVATVEDNANALTALLNLYAAVERIKEAGI